MTLEYLRPYADRINLSQLEKIKEERLKLRLTKDNIHIMDMLEKLPEIQVSHKDFSTSTVSIGSSEDLQEGQLQVVEEALEQLIPWRKGPFNLFGIDLDAEWRSDKKWDRFAGKIGNLKNKKVLDIGCNNGYFMFKMLEEDPELVLGIDPVVPVESQFRLLNHFLKDDRLKFELFGVEHLEHFKEFFDTIFCMGIVYHHRHPIQQLIDIREALVSKGEMILETIGIPGEESYALFPEDRYAKMKNVWFIPTLSCFINWAKKAKFIDVEVISSTVLTPEEQRNTKWCPDPFQTLEDFLDPNDPTKTIEGHPAPMRFLIKARKK